MTNRELISNHPEEETGQPSPPVQRTVDEIVTNFLAAADTRIAAIEAANEKFAKERDREPHHEVLQ